jgi:hypothetical protein
MKPDATPRIYQTKVSTIPSYWSALFKACQLGDARTCPSADLDRLSVLDKLVIGIAVKPALAGLGRRNDWVRGRASVLGCVTVRRVVATMRAAALPTRTQMNPRSADLDALRALTSCRLFDGGDRVDVGAALIRHDVGSLTKHLMNKGDGDGSLSDGGRHALDVAAAHVANGEHSWPIRL